LVSGTMMIFQEQFVGAYLPDAPDALPYAYERMGAVMMFYFLCGIMEIFLGGLRGLNVSFLPMVATILGVCGLRLLWIYTVFPLPDFHTIGGLFLCYPISWVITALFHMGCFIHYFRLRSKKWRMASLPPDAAHSA